MECLNCKKEFEPKRPHGKFCSDKCRVAYNRANPQNKVTNIQMQVLYAEMLKMASEFKGFDIKMVDPITPQVHVALINAENKDQHTFIKEYDYAGLKELISTSTSSYDLESAWRIVNAAKGLVGWQLRELTRLKELQRTKIDF
jgi:predicted nucleic acid-binding Zn ribbon protein